MIESDNEFLDYVEKWTRGFMSGEAHDRLFALARRGAEVDTLRAEVERLRAALERIKEWADAYPLDVFPEPDLRRVNEVLEQNGMSLEAVSASAMRHVLNGVRGIVTAALAQEPADDR